MEWSKVKNIIILLLLLVNGFLLVLVVARHSGTDQYQRSALTQAVEVLEHNGIQVEQSALADAQGLSSQSVERSLDVEEALAAVLLGDTLTREDQGGGLYAYRSELGQVSIRSGGAISARLAEDERWRTGDPQGHAASLLAGMGIQAQAVQANLDEEGTGSVRFRQLWQDVPVFSSHVTFTYRQGALASLSGVLLIQDPGQVTAGAEASMTLPTALLRFLDGILANGDLCSSVQAMTPGWLMSQSFSGLVSLSPAWQVSTDMAQYYLNAVTGELTRTAAG